VLRLVAGKTARDRLFERLKWYDTGRAVILGIFYPVTQLTRLNRLFLFLPHEKRVARFLIGLKGNVFIDIGANLGFYTALLCRNFTKIAAIEPHPEDMQTLMKNVRRLTGNVVFVQKAVSETDGYADFSFGGRTLDGDGREQSLVHQDMQWPKCWRTDKVRKVETTNVESLVNHLAQINPMFRNVDLIKVDVEGAEWAVLVGARNVMKQIKSWLIELHNTSRKCELENLFDSYDYKHTWIDNNHVFAWKK
jgi:FkbM family methyltransferase